METETVRRLFYFPEMYGVALIKIVVIRCYFNINFELYYGNAINKQRATALF